jgi:hypothetical protein
MSDVSLMNRTASDKKRGSAAAQPHAQQAALLTLGIAPVIFSGDRVRIGRMNPEEHGLIKMDKGVARTARRIGGAA